MTVISELINQMILEVLESAEWTSANPTHINHLIQVNAVDNPDFEAEIKKLMEESVEKETKFKTDSSGKQKVPDTGDLTSELKNISKEDAQGILTKVGITPQNTNNLIKMMTSGQGIGGALLGAGSKILPPLALTLMVAQMIPVLVKELARPGGFLDKRVKIDMRKEAFATMDRQTRQNTRIGDRQVIIQQFQGFRNFDGYASVNTSDMIRKNADRVLDIGLFDRAQGISPSVGRRR